jgi:hypothetical protein
MYMDTQDYDSSEEALNGIESRKRSIITQCFPKNVVINVVTCTISGDKEDLVHFKQEAFLKKGPTLCIDSGPFGSFHDKLQQVQNRRLADPGLYAPDPELYA